ncbi:unnamed protein product, partial [Mesorhabditis belari]|uniref:Uncharacterized protein n=1 Tax=Mesorhabditis belari TaxID=2138241 RepID=A0AAF3ES48_9BILA
MNALQSIGGITLHELSRKLDQPDDHLRACRFKAASPYGSDFYTCTFSRLGNLDMHHLKEHIAVAHLMRVKYRCLQCSLEVLTSDDASPSRMPWNMDRVAMKALDKLQRFCDDAIQSEINRKMEALRYFGAHRMAALQFNKENPTQSIG